KNQQQLEEIQNLNRQLAASKASHLTLESERSVLNAALTELGEIPWSRFQAALKQRADVLADQCTKIYEQARHDFRPSVRRQGNEKTIRAAIAELIEGRSGWDSGSKIADLTSLI